MMYSLKTIFIISLDQNSYLINCLLKSHPEATKELYAMDLIILKHDQVLRMTPELALHFPNYHILPT